MYGTVAQNRRSPIFRTPLTKIARNRAGTPSRSQLGLHVARTLSSPKPPKEHVAPPRSSLNTKADFSGELRPGGCKQSSRRVPHQEQRASGRKRCQPATRSYRSHNKIMPNILEILRCFKFAKREQTYEGQAQVPFPRRARGHKIGGGGRPAGPAVLGHP